MTPETAVLYVEEALDLGDLDEIMMALNGWAWAHRNAQEEETNEDR